MPTAKPLRQSEVLKIQLRDELFVSDVARKRGWTVDAAKDLIENRIAELEKEGR